MSKIPVIKEEAKPRIDLALLDMDILRYELGSVQADHPFLHGEKIPASVEMIHRLVDERVESILKATGAIDYIAYLTGPGNFRFDIATLQPYKGNRDSVEKPYHWKTVDEYVRLKYFPKEVCGQEADDALAIEQRRNIGSGFNTVICSRDKDLRTCEGYHYSWACGDFQKEKPLYYIERLEGTKFFFKQMLTGDTTDNIIGCGKKIILTYKSGAKAGQEYLRRQGVGPVAADKILTKGKCPNDWYNLVRDNYKAVFGDDADRAMLENARLLYIGQTLDNLFDWSWLCIKAFPTLLENPLMDQVEEDDLLEVGVKEEETSKDL